MLFIASYAFGIAILYTRIFRADEYGQYSFYVALAGPTIMALAEWIAQPISRYYSEYKTNNSLDILWHTLTFFVAGLLMFFVVGISAIWYFLSTKTNDLPMYYIIPTICIVVLQSLTSILLPIFPSSFRARIWRNITAFTPILATLITLGLIYFSGKHAFYILYGQAVALAVFLPLVIYLSGWKIKLHHLSLTPVVKATVTRMANYGIPMMLWFFSSNMLDVGDRLLLHWFRSEKELGVYAVSYSMMGGIVALLNLPINVAIGPVLYNFWSQGKRREAAESIFDMSRMYIYLASMLTVTVSLFGPVLLTQLLGKDFRSGVDIIIPIMLARMVWGISMIGQKTLELNEKTKQLMQLALWSALANTLLNLVLIPRYGIYAAALTTLLCNILYGYLVYKSSLNIMAWRIQFSSVVKPILVSCTVLAMCFVSQRLGYSNLYLNVVVEFAAVAAIIVSFFDSGKKVKPRD